MKLHVTEEELAGHRNATIRGAAEGTIASAAVAYGASHYFGKRWASFRQLPRSLKVLGGIVLVAPCLTIQAERRGLEFDQAQWTDAGAQLLTDKEAKEEARWEALSTTDKISDWASRHEYSIIMASWALSLAAAGAIISRDKYQTGPQKVVQARMWAQGLTIGILIAAGALKHGQRADTAAKKYEDHSWRDVLEQQEKEKKEDEQRIQEITAKDRRAAWNIQ
ncbi:Replication factor C, subunit RFC4 [Marasmius tenuissimus]|uniref:Replication factor C, subunit RFC4 n=1 Tax=Marasmius tenuissimus TaxID=585030 RepID=A0ABR3A987_9AGAR|nr:Replication factor C, subunit RFC4 [Marasmius tenuissimus]